MGRALCDQAIVKQAGKRLRERGRGAHSDALAGARVIFYDRWDRQIEVGYAVVLLEE